MVALFACLVFVIVLVGIGLVLFKKAGVEIPLLKLVEPDTELDENIPVEDLHSIIKHQYVPYVRDEAKVLAQVECICGWSDATATTSYAKSRGEQHVNNERDRILRKREAARKVAEKLAENEKGDFAW